ncbi:3-oxoacid CoA-transferase subunit A [Achromobacter xylosoxidans]
MIDKIQACMMDAVAVIPDGASVLVGGFGEAGVPYELLHCLAELGRRDLTIIANNAGTFDRGIAALLDRRQVRKIICSHPRPPISRPSPAPSAPAKWNWNACRKARWPNACARPGRCLAPAPGYGTELAQGRRQEVIDGVGYVLEQPLRGDYALIRAHQGDRWGNLMYRHAARNFNPVMCMAAGHAIAQVDEVVPLGAFAPEHIMTPGLFVKTVVRVET